MAASYGRVREMDRNELAIICKVARDLWRFMEMDCCCGRIVYLFN